LFCEAAALMFWQAYLDGQAKAIEEKLSQCHDRPGDHIVSMTVSLSCLA
jgi:hypothetical protein